MTRHYSLTILAALAFAGCGLHLPSILAWETAKEVAEVELEELMTPLDFIEVTDVATRGGLYTETDAGEVLEWPLLSTEVRVHVRGAVQTTEIVHRFANPASEPVNASFLFPLPENAAVYGMVLTTGDVRIRAQIDRVEQATETYEAAAANGQQAALTTQERPNLFTQRVANLTPGHPVEVSLSLVQNVRRSDGMNEVVVPLTAGPRFEPGTSETAESPDSSWHDSTPAPQVVAGITTEMVEPRVSIEVDLAPGVEIHDFESQSHNLQEDWYGPERVVLSTDGRVFDDRDFVLRYALRGDSPNAGVVSHFDERGGFVSLLIEPPASAATVEAVPRELVFVLDTSGSMDGQPLNLSRALATRLLRRAGPDDTFRVVLFDDHATVFSADPVPASEANVESAVEFLEAIRAGGGTRMVEGLDAALAPREESGRLRMVIFLTDGYIGNDAEVMGHIERLRGEARLFGIGVGQSVNRDLLTQMGRVGRGFTRVVTLDESVGDAVDSIAGRLETPVWTDIRVDWGPSGVHSMTPDPVRDLFVGDTIELLGRYETPGTYRIVVTARAGGELIELPMEVELTGEAGPGEALALGWARATIADRMTELRLAGSSRDSDRAERVTRLEDEVTQLGLSFSLLTQWTAFVAVAEPIVNDDPSSAADMNVPVTAVDGVGASGYGMSSFGGSAAPEPVTWLALLAAAAGVAGVRRRRVNSSN